MTLMYLKPAPGRVCPMPEKGGELLPDAGAEVPRNAWWQRRLADGDAVVVDSKKSKGPKP